MPNVFSLLFLSFQLFTQVGLVMIKPLREAYENYERMRIEEEAVKAGDAVSSTTETDSAPSGNKEQQSSKKLTGVSNEVMDMFDEENKETKPADEDKETLSGTTIKNPGIKVKKSEMRSNKVMLLGAALGK